MENNVTNIFDTLSEQFSHFNHIDYTEIETNNESDGIDVSTNFYDLEMYEPNTFSNYTFNNIIDNLSIVTPSHERPYLNLDISNINLTFHTQEILHEMYKKLLYDELFASYW